MPRRRVGFKQRDLVAEAFAGDNVVEVSLPTATPRVIADQKDFAQEKQRAIEADAPKVEDTSLPGWVRSGLLILRIMADVVGFLGRQRCAQASGQSEVPQDDCWNQQGGPQRCQALECYHF
jgi:hypothetical protein